MTDMLKESLGNLGAYLWFGAIAVLGGTASYIGKVKANRQKAFSFVELLGEWVVSAFVGFVTGLICIDLAMSFELTLAFVGIAGHAGGRAVYLLEQATLGRLGVELQSSNRKDED